MLRGFNTTVTERTLEIRTNVLDYRINLRYENNDDEFKSWSGAGAQAGQCYVCVRSVIMFR